MLYFVMGFALACVWGWGCYRAGKCSAENAYLKQQEKENEYMEKIFIHTADLQRDELLKRLHRTSHP